MAKKEAESGPEEILVPCGRAFFVYYVAIVIFLLGPRLNPNVTIFGVFRFSEALGTLLGLALVALVVYLRLGREYRLSEEGLATRWRWPSPRQQEITWENLGNVLLRRGLSQSILRVGNLVIEDKSGGPEMFWFGLANPKEVQEEIARRRRAALNQMP
ncbi:MAG: PH domain-containing protein [Desulfobaccales bacterium]